jgi:hypothetical protein
MMRLLILSLTSLLILSAPAHADPVTGIIAAGKAFLATKIGAFVAQIALSKGLSLIAQKLRKTPERPGLQNQFKGRGASEPDGFILGRAPTMGHWVWHGSSGDNNKWYHEVIELGGLPGQTLQRLIIDGEYTELGDVYSEGDDVFGNIIVAKNKDSDSHRAFIKVYDGTQTAADPMLVARCGTGDRAWTAAHVLRGKPYAVLSYYFDRKRFPRGVPELRFECMGIPVYDPRKDSTVGGTGAHRWADPATWEPSENLVVLIYNIMRGIAAPGGGIWGGNVDAEDLPIANWVAAMNDCDATFEGRPKYRGGLEVKWTDLPKDVIDKLLAACGGQMVDVGGFWYIQVDAPETATVAITDDDVLVSEPSERKPFPGLEGTFNGVTLTFPDPELLWNANPDFTLRNEDWAAEDGSERIFDLQLSACPYPEQGKQLANALAEDNRRFLAHNLPLPPEYTILRPLNTLAWTSAFNGYDAKLFEIAEMSYDLRTFNSTVSVRERDPNDFTPLVGLELPSLPPASTTPARLDAGLPGFDFVPVTVDDGNGNRRIAFKLIWNAGDIENTVSGLAYELRLTGNEELVLNGDIADVSRGELVLPGQFIPAAGYDVRGRALSRVRDTDWTLWISRTAPAVSDQVRLVQLATGAQVFTYDAAGANPSPATTIFTTSVRGAIETPYFEWFVDDVSQGAPSIASSFAYTPKASASAMPDVVRVELRDGGPTADIVASDRITVIGLTPGEQSVAMILTNEAHTVPAAPDGSGEDLAGAFTDVQVYVGTQLDTSNWSISRVNGPGVSSSLSGNRITITDLNVDAGYVDITAGSTGYSSITKRFTLTKARRGVPGIDGDNGQSIAQLMIFRRASTPPATPIGGSYEFGVNTLTPPTNWSVSPPAGADPLYTSLASASIVGQTGTDSNLTWSDPEVFAVDGSAGRSTYQAAIYRRAASQPATPSGGSFNFGTNTLTPPSGWSIDVPNGTDPVWVCRELFSVIGDTGTDSAGSWSTPTKFAEDGTDGRSTFQITVYRRSTVQLSTPSGGSYNFGTQAISAPSGWSSTIPSGSSPIYASTALASVQGTTGTDFSLSWSYPRVIAQNGEDGDPGAPGDRGPGRWHISRSPLPNSSYNAQQGWRFGGGSHPSTPVVGDQAWFYTGSLSNPTGQSVWICTSVSSSTSHSWVEQNEVIDGNLLVTDTITASVLRIDGITIDSDGSGRLIVKDGGIDTDQLQNSSVTEIEYEFDSYWRNTSTNGWRTALSVNPWVNPQGNPLMINVSFQLDQMGTQTGVDAARWRLRFDDPPYTIHQEPYSPQWSDYDTWHSASVFLPTPGTGGKRIALDFFNPLGAAFGEILRDITITPMRVKK